MFSFSPTLRRMEVLKCAVIERETEKSRAGCRFYRVYERGFPSFTQDKTGKSS